MTDYGSLWVTGLLLAELLPFILLGRLAGVLVDRVESRKLLMILSFGQAGIAATLSLVSSPGPILILTALLGMLASVERPAASTLVPHITGEGEATRGYARLSSGRALGMIAGPALGGILTAAGGLPPVMFLNAASFIVVGTALVAVTARRRPLSQALAKADGSESARAGLSWILADPVLRIAIPLTAVAAGVALADNVAAPYRFTHDLGAGAIGFGVYEALYSVCELIGIQIFTLKVIRGHEERLLALGNFLLAAGIIGIGLAGNYVLALVAATIGGIGNGMSNTGESVIIRLRTPEAGRGRAFAASNALIQSGSVLGAGAGAPAVAALGAATTMVLTGALSACASIGALTLALSRRRPAGNPSPTNSDQYTY